MIHPTPTYPLDTIYQILPDDTNIAVEGITNADVLLPVTSCISEPSSSDEGVVIYRRADGYHAYGCFSSCISDSYRNLLVFLLTADTDDILYLHISENIPNPVEDADLSQSAYLVSAILGTKAKTVFVVSQPVGTYLTILASACNEICLCDTGALWYAYKPGCWSIPEATAVYRPMFNEVLLRSVDIHHILTEEEYQSIIDNNATVYKIGIDFQKAVEDKEDPVEDLIEEEPENDLDDIEDYFTDIADETSSD